MKAKIAGAVGSAFWLASGLYLSVWMTTSEPAPVRAREALGNVAFGLLYAMPGVLGLLSLRRPALMVPAIAGGFALTLTAFTLAPVFLIFTLLMVLARVRAAEPAGVRARVAALAVLTTMVIAWIVLQSHDDPYCWSSPGGVTMNAPGSSSSGSSEAPPGSSGGGCGSDLITTREGATGLPVVLSIPFVAWWIAGATRSAGSQPGFPAASRDA